MWPYFPDLLSKSVPRYTSFPTAAEFGAIASATLREALQRITGETSIYVHIPFCEKICFYCGCNTGSTGSQSRLDAYLEALHQEIATISALLPTKPMIRRIAFGGGSPNAIRPASFIQLVTSLIANFGITEPDISIELDPRTLTPQWADAIKNVGIKRASLGVQTFAPHCQKAIGRIQPYELVARTTEMLRDAGVTSLSFDLMYGLPKQTKDDLRDSLQQTYLLGADRVALFGYAHLPHAIPRQRAVDDREMPDQNERFMMAQLGYLYFVAHGYCAVGFDHFARTHNDPLAIAANAGTLRRNFQGFTDDTAENVIGLGSSAISSFPHLIAQNEKNSGRYRMRVSNGQLAVASGVVRTEQDRIRSRIIEDLLCRGTAPIPKELEQDSFDALKVMTDRGLAHFNDNRLTITAEGLPYSRVIATTFDPYRQQAPARFSSAV